MSTQNLSRCFYELQDDFVRRSNEVHVSRSELQVNPIPVPLGRHHSRWQQLQTGDQFKGWACLAERRYVPREAVAVLGAHGLDPLQRRHVGGVVFEDRSTAAENHVASNHRLFDATEDVVSREGRNPTNLCAFVNKTNVQSRLISLGSEMRLV